MVTPGSLVPMEMNAKGANVPSVATKGSSFGKWGRARLKT